MKPRRQNYRQHVDLLIEAALAAAEPAACVGRALRRDGQTLIVAEQERFDLSQGRVFLVSVGKASVPMAKAALEVVGDALATGVVIYKKSEREWTAELEDGRLRFFAAGHPVSDEQSIEGAAAVVEMLKHTGPEDLVLCLISGGASALMTQPMIPLEDWQALLAALLGSGCTINELNMVRRQLDRVKGGGLAAMAAPATCFGLILSDVVGNPLEFIGSGPTVEEADDAPAPYAAEVLGHYDIATQVGRERWQRLADALRQTQYGKAPAGNLVRNFIVGDVRQAAVAAQVRAMQLGFVTQLLTCHLEGEAREVGRVASAIARDLSPGHCLIMGGETTVTLQGEGMGGRNQELALAAAIGLEGLAHAVVACFGTDGEDGPTTAAGAVVTGETAAFGRRFGLNPQQFLANNDSYHFFQHLDEQILAERQEGGEAEEPSNDEERKTADLHHIITGPTGTNVNDLLFILSYEV